MIVRLMTNTGETTVFASVATPHYRPKDGLICQTPFLNHVQYNYDMGQEVGVVKHWVGSE